MTDDSSSQPEELQSINETNSNITKPTIVLDLDETIISAGDFKISEDCIAVKVGKRRHAFVRLRPGLSEFLQEAAKHFEIFFFTASSEFYANQIIDIISPNTPKDHRLFRKSCVNLYGYPVKDLTLIKRPMEHILLIDDVHGSALLQPDNLVHIVPWNGSSDDNVLLTQLLPLLNQIKFEPNLPLAYHSIIGCNQYHSLNTFG